MVGEVTYATFLTNAQANLWDLISNDSVIQSYTKNVLDGIPVGLTKGTGFPYIIIPTPTVPSAGHITLTHVREIIEFKVDVFDRRERVLRPLCDRIRDLCEHAEVLFRNTYGMLHFITGNTTMSYVVVEDGSIVYNYTMNLTWEWVLWD